LRRCSCSLHCAARRAFQCLKRTLLGTELDFSDSPIELLAETVLLLSSTQLEPNRAPLSRNLGFSTGGVARRGSRLSTPTELAQLARGIIEHVTKDRDGPASVGDALTTAFARFQQHTSTIVGEAGYHGLKERALYLTRSDLKKDPALSSIDLSPVLDQSWTRTVEELGKLAACKYAAVLLGRVFGLLGSFIDEALTVRLISRTWTELDLSALVPLRGEG
jgi:hypothetical protein